MQQQQTVMAHLHLYRMLALRHPHTTLRPYYRVLSTSFCCHKLHTFLNKTSSVPLLRVHASGGVPDTRHIAEWNTKRDIKAFSPRDNLVVIFSMATFLLYFMWLREPSDIDEYMSRPIWERLPGISPEKAEQMMEVDKSLGLQVDYTALEKYKEEYYAKEVEKMEKEQQLWRKHQELLQGVSSSSVKVPQPSNLKD